MKIDVFNDEAGKIWKRFSDNKGKPIEALKLELELYKKLLVFFQVGESCCFVFNFQDVRFEFVSNEAESLLGYPKAEITAELILESIHPDDRAWFLNCQEVCVQFIESLPPDKQMKYKPRIDFRIRKKSGEYIRIMHQAVILQNNNDGKVFRNLVIFTDISHLKQSGRPVMSYIGMEGEPSYVDVNVHNYFSGENDILSRREKEILFHLIEGKLSKEIAQLLCITKDTVDKHRKNMLRKMNVNTTGELTYKAIREGWV